MYKELIRSIQSAATYNLESADKADVESSYFTAGQIKAFTDVLRGLGHEVETGSWDDDGCDRIVYIKIDGVFLVRYSKINFDSFSELLMK